MCYVYVTMYVLQLLPCVQNENPYVRDMALHCLGLACLLDISTARNHLLLFLQVWVCGCVGVWVGGGGAVLEFVPFVIGLPDGTESGIHMYCVHRSAKWITSQCRPQH